MLPHNLKAAMVLLVLFSGLAIAAPAYGVVDTQPSKETTGQFALTLNMDFIMNECVGAYGSVWPGVTYYLDKQWSILGYMCFGDEGYGLQAGVAYTFWRQEEYTEYFALASLYYLNNTDDSSVLVPLLGVGARTQRIPLLFSNKDLVIKNLWYGIYFGTSSQDFDIPGDSSFSASNYALDIYAEYRF